MSELDRIVVKDERPPQDSPPDVSAVAVRAVIADARIEVAALLGAASAVEQLAMSCVEAGDDVAAKACLRVVEQLQEGAQVAQATLDALMVQYGSVAQ